MRIVNRKKFLVTSIALLAIITLAVVLIGVNIHRLITKTEQAIETTSQTAENQQATSDSQTVNKQQNQTSQNQPEEVQASDNTVIGNMGEADIFTSGSMTQVVNKQYSISSDYEADDLVWLDLPATRDTQLRAEAADALTNLFEAAQNDGIELYCCSGYRSYATQSELYQWNVDTYGQTEADLVSAKPGTSEHQLGLAMDVTSESVGFDLLESFGETEEGKYVRDHAHEYGFIIRYPQGKTAITGYSYEPWHLRYVGVEVATDIYNSGQTMEEYYGLI